jgi:hypothetical protein
MFCGIQPTPTHHHHHSLLRSFRSHRSHRHRKDSTADSLSQEEMHHHHRHVPSDASSLSRPSLDSTSSRRTDLSIDWDPLRLHPSLSSGPSPPLQDAFSDSTSRRYQPHELRHARSSQGLRRPSTSHHQPTQSTVIYDGFDFGFNNNPTRVMTKPAAASNMMRRAPSPTPSDASSESSFSLGEPSDEEMGLGLGLSPAPALRSRPRPRPCYDDGADEAESFIRRGGWKRRGIVFVNSGSPLAGEDETFEI